MNVSLPVIQSTPQKAFLFVSKLFTRMGIGLLECRNVIVLFDFFSILFNLHENAIYKLKKVKV